MIEADLKLFVFFSRFIIIIIFPCVSVSLYLAVLQFFAPQPCRSLLSRVSSIFPIHVSTVDRVSQWSTAAAAGSSEQGRQTARHPLPRTKKLFHAPTDTAPPPALSEQTKTKEKTKNKNRPRTNKCHSASMQTRKAETRDRPRCQRRKFSLEGEISRNFPAAVPKKILPRIRATAKKEGHAERWRKRGRGVSYMEWGEGKG